MTEKFSTLSLKNLGIDTYKEPVIYMRKDCHICQSEGFEAQTRIQVNLHDRSIIATLNTVESDLLHRNEASLSTQAWNLLNAKEGDEITVAHPKYIKSLSYVRSKLYGNELQTDEINQIIKDVHQGYFSDIHIAMFLSATVNNNLNKKEIKDLTQAMVNEGRQLSWNSSIVVDKHCVGGLAGNRTTLIVVPIVAAYGLTIPKTSSRAITSPAGTADTMEVFAPVNLSLQAMKKVVEKENGCIVWGGGAIDLSPVDDLLIRVERAMNVDSEGQMIASILSKKIAAGSTHIVIDMPVGPTAKVRSQKQAEFLKNYLEVLSNEFAIKTQVILTDGSHPIGRGIGPALEAKDALSVLSCDSSAPNDLRDKALTLAGHLLEFSPDVPAGSGKSLATAILDSGKALHKFNAICRAQGGFFEIPKAPYTHVITAKKSGKLMRIDNHYLIRLASLAGAPQSKSAGVELLASLHSFIQKNQPLFMIHANSKGELNYALSYLEQGHEIFYIEENHVT